MFLPAINGRALLFLLAACILPHFSHAEGGNDKYIGEYYGPRFGRNQPKQEDEDRGYDEEEGGGMTGIGLIFLILFVVALLAGIYFAAWCVCGVQRSRKEGHYRLNDSANEDDPEDPVFNKKHYPGLDMVDEAKESTYVKNRLSDSLDHTNENRTTDDSSTLPETSSSAAAEAKAAEAAAAAAAPSAPDGDDNSGGGNNNNAEA